MKRQGIVGSEGRRSRVARSLLLGFLAESALVVDEGLELGLGYVVRVNIFYPRTVERVISPSPKRVNEGNKGGLSIKLLEGKSSSKESVIVGGNIFGRSLRFAEIIIGGRDGIRAAGPIGREYGEVGLSANVRIFGRNAREHVEISLLDVASNKASELDLHCNGASSTGEVVAPLRDGQKTVGGTRSAGLESNMGDPCGKAIIRKYEIQSFGCNNGSLRVHFVRMEWAKLQS
jgi:hypothetical protein